MFTTALHSLAVNYVTDPYPTVNTNHSSPLPIIIGVAVAIIVIGGTWKVFTKAKQPGWAALIPIFDTWILLKIVNRPWWWLILMFIPVVNFIALIFVYHDLAKAFGHGVGMTLLLVFLPFIGLPVLGFGKSTYNAKAVVRV